LIFFFLSTEMDWVSLSMNIVYQYTALKQTLEEPQNISLKTWLNSNILYLHIVINIFSFGISEQ